MLSVVGRWVSSSIVSGYQSYLRRVSTWSSLVYNRLIFIQVSSAHVYAGLAMTVVGRGFQVLFSHKATSSREDLGPIKSSEFGQHSWCEG